MISRVLIDAMKTATGQLSSVLRLGTKAAADGSREITGTSRRGLDDLVDRDEKNALVIRQSKSEMSRQPAGDTSASTPRAKGRDLIDELDYRQLHSVLRGKTTGDPMLREICRRQGFDGPPTLVGVGGIRDIVPPGTELFRGVPIWDYADQFKSGEYFGSSGANGSGIYATTKADRAKGYADDTGGEVIHMALRPDARTTLLNRLLKEQDKELRPIHKELTRLKRGEQTEAAIVRKQALEEQRKVLANPGRFAAIKGYDAFRMGKNADEWLILNRTALVVER
ncbi:hypothetical protein [Nocardia sp. NPDC050412]|uniref:hypothetical protein n=2 Tax=Nocardia TaxID=1817 RepID=UPI003788D2D3